MKDTRHEMTCDEKVMDKAVSLGLRLVANMYSQKKRRKQLLEISSDLVCVGPILLCEFGA